MKIAIIAFSSLPSSVGGSQIFTFNLIKKLISKNNQVDLYLPRKYAKEFRNSKTLVHKNLRIKSILFRENFFALYLPVVLRLIIYFHHVLNHYHLWQAIGSYPAGYIIDHLGKIVPIFLRSHGDDIQKSHELNYGLRLDPYFEKKIKKTLKKFTYLIALTESVKQEYLELGAKKETIVIIPNGVDNKRFNLEINKKKFDKNKKIQILTTGRYHKKKGYEYIIPIAKKLLKKGYDFEWEIIGRNTCKLNSLVNKNKLQNFIKLKESIAFKSEEKNRSSYPTIELIKHYKKADFFVFPSLLETFGMVIIEAMASGVPVITSDCPGCRDIVKNNKDGLISKMKNPVSFANNIEKLILDKNLRRKIIRNGLITSSNHDWSIIVKKYLSLYKGIKPF